MVIVDVDVTELHDNSSGHIRFPKSTKARTTSTDVFYLYQASVGGLSGEYLSVVEALTRKKVIFDLVVPLLNKF